VEDTNKPEKTFAPWGEETQLAIMKFFMKTSIPRLLKAESEKQIQPEEIKGREA